MQYYVYILSNSRHTVLYVGLTSDIHRRVYQHKTKAYKGFTSKYSCDQLVYFESFDQVFDAISREMELKKWRREWKETLIRENNPSWDDLSVGWYDEESLGCGLPRGSGFIA
jgi:putative endonuclease